MASKEPERLGKRSGFSDYSSNFQFQLDFRFVILSSSFGRRISRDVGDANAPEAAFRPIVAKGLGE